MKNNKKSKAKNTVTLPVRKPVKLTTANHAEIDTSALAYWLNTPTKVIMNGATVHSDYWFKFIQRKEGEYTPVLLVAHLDTVCELSGIKSQEKNKIFAHGLDDRLGAFIACSYLPALGIKCDVLLTDHEEEGQSTAQFFGLASRYNWVCEFDRAGADCVTYGIDSKAWLSVLSDYFPLGRGSFSDIAFLPSSPCCVNIGTGYEKAHSPTSYFVISTMQKQVARFIELYRAHGATKFETDCAPEAETRETHSSYLGGYNWEWNTPKKKSGNSWLDDPEPSPHKCADCFDTPAYFNSDMHCYLCMDCEEYYKVKL